MFFGSRGGAIAASSDSGAPAYDFVNIDTDADALAVAGQDEAASGARELSVFTAGADTDNTITETTVFGAVSAAQASLEPRTLANVLGISSTGVASAEGGQVLNGLIPTAVLFWTLTTSAGTYSTGQLYSRYCYPLEWELATYTTTTASCIQLAVALERAILPSGSFASHIDLSRLCMVACASNPAGNPVGNPASNPAGASFGFGSCCLAAD